MAELGLGIRRLAEGLAVVGLLAGAALGHGAPPPAAARLAAQPIPTVYPITPTAAQRTAVAAALPTVAAGDLAALGLVPATWADGIPARAVPATVTHVTDGDTIEVRFDDGAVERVRLLLIDTPETKRPDTPVQCYGPEASEWLARALPRGIRVWLEPDVEDRDRYGRLLRYVWLEEDGEPYLVNESIVRNGLGVRTIYPPNVQYVDEIGAAQTAARNDGKGLWSACGVWGPAEAE